ncbi:MAG: hypothetical protein B7Z33_11630 [Sphingomonadales bacterium 12-68-11]|nr:MAG: hypothetical protein B7Z33_11630 [Sphingomonadales bacterium 12-68-11]
MTGANPFDWYGGAFLALYAILFVVSFIASFAIAAWLRPEGREVPPSGEDELAVLAGGKDRLTETLLSRLLARGVATIERGKFLFDRRVPVNGAVEREIVALSAPASWKAVGNVVGRAAERIQRDLEARGLLMDAGEARQLGLYAAMPLAILLLFGLIKVQVGLGRERPVGFLIAFMVVTAVVALIRVFATDRRTRGGKATLKRAQASAERLKLAAPREETGMAVALFGTAVLVGSPLADFHKLRQSSSDGSGGSGDSGGDGGGGGGCGGCGGS